MRIRQPGGKEQTKVRVVGDDVVTNFNAHLAAMFEQRSQEYWIQTGLQFEANVFYQAGLSESYTGLEDAEDIFVSHLDDGYPGVLVLLFPLEREKYKKLYVYSGVL